MTIESNRAITEGRYADIHGARLYYEVAGAGRPLVLIHAGIADSRMWDSQWSEFAGHYQVIRYDMRGFGRSEMPAEPFAYHADLKALLDSLGIERAGLLGVSMGGKVAIDFTLAHPERVDALIVVAAPVGGYDRWSEEMRRFGAEEDAALERGDLAAATELNLRMWVDGPYRNPAQVDPAVRELVRDMQFRAFAQDEPAAELQPLVPPAIGRLAEIRVPTLVIVGDQDVRDILAIAGLLEAGIPAARQVIIAGAAHLPSMEQPARFNRLVLDFLEALP